MRVLLADDHRGLLEVIRGLLKIEVEIVGSVSDGESLFDAAMELHPDIIVTDISMPRLNGLEAVNRLRESGCSSKVVFLTSHTDPDSLMWLLKKLVPLRMSSNPQLPPTSCLLSKKLSQGGFSSPSRA
jgi:DNA-binding NarL/FixJ family response regulator